MELTFLDNLGQSTFVIEVFPGLSLENVMAVLEVEVIHNLSSHAYFDPPINGSPASQLENRVYHMKGDN